MTFDQHLAVLTHEIALPYLLIRCLPVSARLFGVGARDGLVGPCRAGLLGMVLLFVGVRILGGAASDG